MTGDGTAGAVEAPPGTGVAGAAVVAGTEVVAGAEVVLGAVLLGGGAGVDTEPPGTVVVVVVVVVETGDAFTHPPKQNDASTVAPGSRFTGDAPSRAGSGPLAAKKPIGTPGNQLGGYWAPVSGSTIISPGSSEHPNTPIQ